MKIAAFPNFALYELSFSIITDERNNKNFNYFTIDDERRLNLKHLIVFQF